MYTRLKNIILSLQAALLAVLTLASCSSANDEPAGPGSADGIAWLSVQARGVDLLNASDEGIERMQQLRIIITSSAGDIEVNDLVEASDLADQTFYKRYKLRARERKVVYAIANPASCGFDFAKYPKGAYLNIGRDLEQWAYTFDPSKPITMTDSRVVEPNRMKPGETYTVKLNLVRVATKFSVSINNKRDEAVTIKSFSIGSLGDSHYLMPHFTGTDGSHPANGEHIISNSGVGGFDFSANDMHWSDWLKEAVDESQANPTDATLADRRGWIIKYETPASARHSRCGFTLPSTTDIAKGATMQLQAHYFAETRSGLLSESEFGKGVAAGYEQHYSFDLSVSSKEGGDKAFTDQPLPNLRALFRNTHVVLDITVYQQKVTSRVSVLPYSCVTLDPGFGWTHLPNKDPEGEEDPNVPVYDPDQPGGGGSLETGGDN